MAEAGDEPVGMAAEAADGEAQLPAQLVEVVTAAILQLAALEQIPDAFVRIEFRSVGGQAFEVQPLRCARREEVLDGLAAVNGRAIPDHQQLTAHLPEQLPEKGHNRRSTERVVLEMGEEAAIWGDGTDHREVVVREGRTQDRRPADRSIGARNEGQEIEAGLVYAEERPVLGRRFA